MTFAAEKLRITGLGSDGEKAAAILTSALKERLPDRAGFGGDVPFLLETDASVTGDGYRIRQTDDGLTISAGRLRGLVFGIGRLLRKCTFSSDGRISSDEDLTGDFYPEKAVRGHQLGYRPLSNTYDKWDVADYRRYMTELMYFGMNTVELIPLDRQNELMRYDSVTMACLVSEAAHELDLDVSVWIPNGDGDEKTELLEREILFQRLPYLDAVFVPGSDPGDLGAKELIGRCVKIKEILQKTHPAAGLWVSAQAPHNAPGWGDVFVEEVNLHKEIFAGVIQGPNRAFDLPELRKKIDASLPIRYYPDICHTVRCEYPLKNVSYVYNTAFGRESVCPRPKDYEALSAQVRPFTVGSVTYSDGVNDDVNKAVWCMLEWDPTLSAEEITEDYARCYLYGRDAETWTAGILNAERLFHRPVLDPKNEFTLYLLTPDKTDRDWRANSLYFFSLCAAFVRKKYESEQAKRGLLLAGFDAGDGETPEMKDLRREIDRVASLLYEEIGMQLDVARFHAYGAERGATLETLDLPITDLQRLRHVKALAESRGDDPVKAMRYDSEKTSAPEKGIYFSFALHPLEALGQTQTGDYYINYLGDRPKVNDGTLPVRLMRVFDHFTLDCRFKARKDADCRLTLTLYRLPEHFFKNQSVSVNGKTIEGFTEKTESDPYLPKDFTEVELTIPAAIVTGDGLTIHIEEPTTGFQTAEIRLEPTAYREDAT